MRRIALIGGFVALLGMVGCGATPQDVEEIKKGQQDILAKLASLDTDVKELKSRPAAAAAAARPPAEDPNKVYEIPIAGSPLKGPKDAPVTIVKFSDYQCPYCARADPLVNEVLAAFPTNVNYTYKQFPLTSIHPNAMPAAKAALAAGMQGKYWEMHKLLFDNYRALGAEDLKKYAGEIGLDVPKWEKDMNSQEVQQQINLDMEQARSAGVRGTPTIFVNGKKLQERSLEGFKAAVESALNKKG
jgi:protein-disulfide isomerase